jgi:hypothetical protein
VPNDIWEHTVPAEHRSDVVCLWCFAHLADEKLIPWDQHIHLYPISMHTHLAQVKMQRKKLEKSAQGFMSRRILKKGGL